MNGRDRWEQRWHPLREEWCWFQPIDGIGYVFSSDQDVYVDAETNKPFAITGH